MFDEFDAERLLKTREAAAFLGFAKGTLENWRCSRSDGPAFFKFSSRVRYRLADLIAWRDGHRFTSTSHTRSLNAPAALKGRLGRNAKPTRHSSPRIVLDDESASRTGRNSRD